MRQRERCMIFRSQLTEALVHGVGGVGDHIIAAEQGQQQPGMQARGGVQGLAGQHPRALRQAQACVHLHGRSQHHAVRVRHGKRRRKSTTGEHEQGFVVRPGGLAAQGFEDTLRVQGPSAAQETAERGPPRVQDLIHEQEITPVRPREIPVHVREALLRQEAGDTGHRTGAAELLRPGAVIDINR